jgi:TPP-dependent indolepyruvate ferredoxin oxidoreductase alpha subunit
MNKDVQEILLHEIRTNRQEIAAARKEIAELKINIFANKLKLGVIMSGISIAFSMLTIYVTEKIKTFM